MLELSPSLLSADFTNLKSEMEVLDKNGVKYLHLDVMDGMFVPNISFGPMIIKQLRPLTNMIFDVHLMIEKPERYVEDFQKSGADILTVHCEATNHLHRVLAHIRQCGMKAGVTLNPATPIETLIPVLYMVDLVLVMIVNPGFGGQSFIRNSLSKIEKLKKWKEENRYNYIIEIDGGVNESIISEISQAGAELFVAGSAVFNDRGIRQNIENLEKLM